MMVDGFSPIALPVSIEMLCKVYQMIGIHLLETGEGADV